MTAGVSPFRLYSAHSILGRSVKAAFYTTNAVTILVCLLTLAYGVWLVATRSQYAALLDPQLYVSVGRIMAVVGALAIINCALAFYNASRQLRFFLYAYSVAGVMIFIMMAIGGVMGFVFRYQLAVQSPMHLKMITSLRELYMVDGHTDLTASWDNLQSNFHCCAVNGTTYDYRMWRTSKWYMRERLHEGEQRKQALPASCCQMTPKGDYVDKRGCLYADLLLDDVQTASGINTDTCYMPLRQDLLHHALVAACLCIGSACVLLIPAFFAAIYASMIQK